MGRVADGGFYLKGGRVSDFKNPSFNLTEGLHGSFMHSEMLIIIFASKSMRG